MRPDVDKARAVSRQQQCPGMCLVGFVRRGLAVVDHVLKSQAKASVGFAKRGIDALARTRRDGGKIGASGENAAGQHGDDGAGCAFADGTQVAARIAPGRPEEAALAVPPVLGVGFRLALRHRRVGVLLHVLQALLDGLAGEPLVDGIERVDDAVADAGDRGFDLVMDGDVARGVEMIAPKAVRDVLKGYRYAN